MLNEYTLDETIHMKTEHKYEKSRVVDSGRLSRKKKKKLSGGTENVLSHNLGHGFMKLYICHGAFNGKHKSMHFIVYNLYFNKNRKKKMKNSCNKTDS